MLRAVVFLCFWFAAEISLAAEAAAPPQDLILEEVRVIGRREALAVAQHSTSAAMIAADSQVSLSRTVGDWLELLPGVSLNGQGGLLQAYSIRGFSRSRIRTEVDGVPILTDRRAGNSASFVPPELLGDVVVEKAATSSLYGSGAMGGVVSLNTASVEGLKVHVDGRSNDEQLSLGVLGGSERFSAGFSLRRAENGEAPNGDPLNTHYEQMAGLVRGRQQAGALAIDYSWLPSVGRDIGRSNALYPDRRRSSTPDDRHSVARVEIRSDKDWLLRMYHHYQDWNTEVEDVGEGRALTTYEAHTLGGLFLDSTAVLGGQGSWGLEWVGRRGVDIRESEYSEQGPSLLNQQVVDGEEDTLGVFLEQAWSISATQLRAGVRVDRIEQQGSLGEDSDTRWSGSLRAEHLASSALTVTAEVATGYRFPSLSERYFNGVTPRGDVLGNPDLNPETRDSVELGLRYQRPEQPFEVSLVAFHSQLDNYIERVRVDENLTTFRNLNDADISGLEAQLTMNLGAARHSLSYQWQEGEDDQGQTLADLNPPEWRYHLSYLTGMFRFNSDFRYRSSRDEFGAGELPLADATIWNLSLGRDLRSRWQGEIYVTNVLDESYRTSADDLAPLQLGRAIGFRLSWTGA